MNEDDGVIKKLSEENERLKKLCERAADAIERIRDYQCNCPEAKLIAELRAEQLESH